jgi:hypothetical protein
VRLPTKSRGFGIISKGELAPGVYLAEALTEGVDSHCVTSIVNTSEEEITIKIPFVELEEVQGDYDNSVLIFPVLLNENGNSLSKLRNELRTEHLVRRGCRLLRFARKYVF